MEREHAETIAKMMDEVIRNRRGASIFPGGVASNLGTIWINEIEKFDDAALATQAVAALYIAAPIQGREERPPTPAELREMYRKLELDAREAVPAIEEGDFVRDLPSWVKGWVVARVRHNDYRVWPQQRPGYDAQQTEHYDTRTHVWPDHEPMPPDQQEAYEAEGAPMTAEDFSTMMGYVP